MLWFAALIACTEPKVEPVCDQDPVGDVALPADDAPHDEPVEWWYWTGHVRDEQGRWYGFEQAFFLMHAGVYNARSVHVALTDVDADTFQFDVVYEGGAFPDTLDSFDLASSGHTAKGGNGHDTLTAAFGGAGFDLSLTSTKRPVYQHGDGYHDYAVGGYTWYYSRQRMAATGTVTVGGEQRAVTGQAWFDHQWGDLLSTTTEGWDWFALQLDDGREIMLFLVNGADDVIGGSITNDGCHTREIAAEELTVTAHGEWTSPATGCTYPMGWDVTVGDETFVITPVREDQELPNTFKTYWEGASVVSGDATGRAYVELAGYCD